MSLRAATWVLAAGLPLATILARPREVAAPEATGPALGRRVFAGEGCIHCHSQYVRPHSLDPELWGPAREPEFSRRQSPALIGNRRQGPDLMNVGLRRPRDWQQRHLVDPRSLVPTSRMPSYAHLFSPGDARGPALLDYLDSLGREPAPLPPPAARVVAPRTERADSGVAAPAGAAQPAVHTRP